MPMVKITRSRQVTIPKKLFKELDLHRGDYLEVTREGDRLVLRPQTMMDREKAKAKQRLTQLLEQVWERNQDVDPELVEQEVAQALKEVCQHTRSPHWDKLRDLVDGVHAKNPDLETEEVQQEILEAIQKVREKRQERDE